MTSIKPKSKKDKKNSLIEDAIIISETTENKKLDDTIESAVNVDEQPELPKLEDVKDGEKKTDNVLIDGKDEINLGSKKIDFNDSESINDFVGHDTKTYDEKKEEKPEKEEQTVEQKIKSFEENSKMGIEEFQELSGAGIDILETALSSLLRWYAKDTVDAPYTISETKKNRLKAQLSMIMMKYKFKFKIEWVFIFTLLVVFATPAKTAYEHRKAVKRKELPIKPKKQ